MNEWFELSEPWWHFAVRGVLTYLGLLVLMRMSGKRSFGEKITFIRKDEARSSAAG